MNTLNRRFQGAIPATKVYDNYSEFVTDLQNVAAKFAGDDARTRSRTGNAGISGNSNSRNSAAQSSSTRTADHGDPMDWTTAKIT